MNGGGGGGMVFSMGKNRNWGLLIIGKRAGMFSVFGLENVGLGSRFASFAVCQPAWDSYGPPYMSTTARNAVWSGRTGARSARNNISEGVGDAPASISAGLLFPERGFLGSLRAMVNGFRVQPNRALDLFRPPADSSQPAGPRHLAHDCTGAVSPGQTLPLRQQSKQHKARSLQRSVTQLYPEKTGTPGRGTGWLHAFAGCPSSRRPGGPAGVRGHGRTTLY